MNLTVGKDEANQRMDKFLRKYYKNHSLGEIFKALRKGDIKINGKKVKENYRLQLGDELVVYGLEENDDRPEFSRIESDIKVMFEDDNMLIVEKWPGVLVHSDDTSDNDTLTDHVRSYLFDKGLYDPNVKNTFAPTPCNRLDRNTSGMVIFAKNFQSLRDINAIIKERKIEKYYVALVQGRIEEGIYEGYIYKDNETNISQVFEDERKGTKKIVMDITSVESVGSYSFIEIKLITGRSHQIRAHLASLGHKIIGDKKYGDKKLNSYFVNKYGLDYQYLYAYKYTFDENEGTMDYMSNRTISAALPQVFKKIKYDVFKF